MAMTKAVKVDKIPEASIINKDFGKIDYCDIYKINKITNDTIDAIVTKIFMIPGWVKKLLKIRDSLVDIIGLRTGDNNSNIDNHYPIGSKAVYFQVLDRNDHEIVMAEDDVHLNFRTSVFFEKNEAFLSVYLTTIVKFNNFWGRLYFFVVKPFHRLIIKSILNKYLCGIDKNPVSASVFYNTFLIEALIFGMILSIIINELKF
jgi:hypothetical protein